MFDPPTAKEIFSIRFGHVYRQPARRRLHHQTVREHARQNRWKYWLMSVGVVPIIPIIPIPQLKKVNFCAFPPPVPWIDVFDCIHYVMCAHFPIKLSFLQAVCQRPGAKELNASTNAQWPNKNIPHPRPWCLETPPNGSPNAAFDWQCIEP